MTKPPKLLILHNAPPIAKILVRTLIASTHFKANLAKIGFIAKLLCTKPPLCTYNATFNAVLGEKKLKLVLAKPRVSKTAKLSVRK